MTRLEEIEARKLEIRSEVEATEDLEKIEELNQEVDSLEEEVKEIEEQEEEFCCADVWIGFQLLCMSSHSSSNL